MINLIARVVSYPASLVIRIFLTKSEQKRFIAWSKKLRAEDEARRASK